MKTYTDFKVRGRVTAYLVLTAALILASILLYGVPGQGHLQAHALLETVAALPALFAGLAAVIHYILLHAGGMMAKQWVEILLVEDNPDDVEFAWLLLNQAPHKS